MLSNGFFMGDRSCIRQKCGEMFVYKDTQAVHNSCNVLHRDTDASVNIIRSSGITLGFDEGVRFSESIEELSLRLGKDDITQKSTASPDGLNSMTT